MRDSWLEDEDVAVLTRQAVDLLDPDLAIDIAPRQNDGPYRLGWGHTGAWTVHVRTAPTGEDAPGRQHRRQDGGIDVALDAGMSAPAALGRTIAALAEGLDERGEIFPRCPGHDHAAVAEVHRDAVLLRCPDSDAEVGRIVPRRPG